MKQQSQPKQQQQQQQQPMMMQTGEYMQRLMDTRGGSEPGMGYEQSDFQSMKPECECV